MTLVSRRFSQRLRPTLAETLHRAHSSVSTTVAHLGDILDGVAHACEVGELDDATIHAVRNDLVRADGRLSLAREDSEAARTRAREELERFLVELMEAREGAASFGATR